MIQLAGTAFNQRLGLFEHAGDHDGGGCIRHAEVLREHADGHFAACVLECHQKGKLAFRKTSRVLQGAIDFFACDIGTGQMQQKINCGQILLADSLRIGAQKTLTWFHIVSQSFAD